MTYLSDLSAMTDAELIAHAREAFAKTQFATVKDWIWLVELRNLFPELLDRFERAAEYVEIERLTLGREDRWTNIGERP